VRLAGRDVSVCVVKMSVCVCVCVCVCVSSLHNPSHRVRVSPSYYCAYGPPFSDLDQVLSCFFNYLYPALQHIIWHPPFINKNKKTIKTGPL